jgi:predicted DNA binding CopG/RHH family protein
MASPPRDRVTIDLRGIGDAVRAAAACRGIGVAQLVRRAIVMSLDLRASTAAEPMERGSDSQTSGQAPAQETAQENAQATAKLTLRLPRAHADALMLNAGALGLSYGEYVARLVDGSRLPQPIAERQADSAALRASNDRLATLSTDLLALVTLLRQAKVEQARPYRDRLESADAEIRRHLHLASALIDRL